MKIEIEIEGFIVIVVLVANVWAIIQTFQSGATTGAKVFWTVLILPVLGFIICFFAGPRPSRS